MAVLDVEIRKAGYAADADVIRNIVFAIEAGELVGLIGPNGAGKSTTIKSLLGLLRSVDGTVAFGGEQGRYAYVPEQPVLYEYMTLWEHLQLAASAYELDEQTFMERAERMLERFRMSGERHKLPTGFSKGMQQKMMLIIGFLLQPDVYVVDEPFVGLDPRATRDFLELLQDERRRGAGVLMCTHVLDTAERICDRIILINDGSVVAQGTLGQVREQAGCAVDAPLTDCFYALT
ncbi:ABC transporter ATP-binding protein [Paenibacillus sacheonensis]|uniref:ATP-binding cassette domain-containing protein n=1 Tax=Paenibacillus sacheonensis TaxID=742054 RepID=A0A7X4YPS9_9BACL|nr:ABC transporter ATP-binding protein [Paenibacillus sacheonensis]MBM7564811.1 ABC-2 type transport system ATP-binding protein [Paenibacillus sacheonensis]NBC69359.1 ATP-binding cassette domain-containing protein [Paenibacillus sacheonensis]